MRKYKSQLDKINKLAIGNTVGWKKATYNSIINKYSPYKPGIYEVGDSDDFGRLIGYIGLYKADSLQHACLKCALDKNNRDIFFTNYYVAKLTHKAKIQGQIEFLQKQLQKLKKIK